MLDILRCIFGAVVVGDFLLAVLIVILAQTRKAPPKEAGLKTVRRGIRLYIVAPDEKKEAKL